MPSERNAAVYFDDILTAIDTINDYVGGITQETFEDVGSIHDAVYYRLLVLTEAAHRLTPDELELCPGPNWSRLQDLGNVLRHADASIDPETIWEILKHDLPPLKLAVKKVLREHFPDAAK